MNSRDKIKTRSAWGFAAPVANEVILRGLPSTWKVFRGADELTASAGASRDGTDWKYTAADNSELPLYVINPDTKEARTLIAHPPVEAPWSELMPDLEHMANNQVAILNIPFGWKLMDGSEEIDNERMADSSYRGSTWRSFRGKRGSVLRIESSDGRTYTLPDPNAAVVTIPDVASLNGPSTPSAAEGSLAFSSVGGWARNQQLIVVSANDDHDRREFSIDASGNATVRLTPGQWIVSVENDRRTTPIVMVAAQTIPLTLTAPGAVASPTATIVVYGVRSGERLQAIPTTEFTLDSARGAFVAVIPHPTEGQRIHVTLVRPDGQNDTRTLALSEGATIEIRFNAASAPEETNYLLWGAAGATLLGIGAWALSTPSQKGP